MTPNTRLPGTSKMLHVLGQLKKYKYVDMYIYITIQQENSNAECLAYAEVELICAAWKWMITLGPFNFDKHHSWFKNPENVS